MVLGLGPLFLATDPFLLYLIGAVLWSSSNCVVAYAYANVQVGVLINGIFANNLALTSVGSHHLDHLVIILKEAVWNWPKLNCSRRVVSSFITELVPSVPLLVLGAATLFGEQNPSNQFGCSVIHSWSKYCRKSIIASLAK